jgi:hypothetical protein
MAQGRGRRRRSSGRVRPWLAVGLAAAVVAVLSILLYSPFRPSRRDRHGRRYRAGRGGHGGRPGCSAVTGRFVVRPDRDPERGSLGVRTRYRAGFRLPQGRPRRFGEGCRAAEGRCRAPHGDLRQPVGPDPVAYSSCDDDATSTFTATGEAGYRNTFGLTP